jgi:hypothetical protein
MPITIDWDTDTRHAIRYDFAGHWTWHEFHQAVQEARILRKDVPGRFDMIANFEESGPMPGGAIQQVKRAIDQAPSDTGKIIIVGGNQFVTVIARTFVRVYRKLGEKIAFAATLQEARAITRQNHAALTPER